GPPARGDREVARAAARVEDAVAVANRLLDRDATPAAVEPGGHDAVHHVVDRRDAVEHPPDALRRERARLDGLDRLGGARLGHRPHRFATALSMPGWSRARSTMKSTRSSTSVAPW